jgi:SSS family solute:Na+ symporter
VGELPPDTRADAVFPYFIMTQLPVGVTGIIFAGLIAAAFSSLDSDLNSLAAVTVEDYYKRFGKNVSDQAALRFSRIMVVIFGAAAIAIAMYYVHADNETVLAIIFTFYAIFSGGIAGLFLLGVCTRRANKQGLYVGIAATVIFTGWALLTSTPLVPGSDPLLDLGALNYTHHSYMLGVYSHLILFGVGYIASLFFKTEAPDENLTVHAWWANRKHNSE